MANWAEFADFTIRYMKQENSGKHVAHNLAAREARGLFFLAFDSDDSCNARALEKIAHHWNTIPLSERPLFFAVNGLCCDQHGNLIGDAFPSHPFDVSLREKQYVYKLRGEKWGAGLTEVIRRYPFPDIKSTHFAPEGMVWLDIAKSYKIWYINEILRTYYVDDAATGSTLSKTKMFRENAPGRLQYFIWLLNNDLEYFLSSPMPFLKAATMLPLAAWASNQSLGSALRSLQSVAARVLVLMTLPGAAILGLANWVWPTTSR